MVVNGGKPTNQKAAPRAAQWLHIGAFEAEVNENVRRTANCADPAMARP